METVKKKILTFVNVVCVTFVAVMMSMTLMPLKVNAVENVEVKGTVTVEGVESTSETFTFELIPVKDAAGTPFDYSVTPLITSRSGAGDFSFTLDLQPGTYYYKVREVPGSTLGWTYDDYTQIIKIEVDSNLVATVTYGNEATASSNSSIVDVQGTPKYEYDSNNKYTNGPVGWLEQTHGSSSAYFKVFDEAGKIIIGLCADKGYTSPNTNTVLEPNNDRKRNDTASALAMALWGVEISGVTNEQWSKLLALAEDSIRTNYRRGKFMQALVWIYEAQTSVTEQGSEFDLFKPGSLDANAWVSNTAVQTLFNADFSIGDIFSLDVVSGTKFVDTATWQEYFHVAALIEEMMAQYHANKETKLELIYTPTGTGTGQLTFSHDGYVPHEHGTFTPDASGKYVATNGAEVYDTYLSWTTSSGLTVNINGNNYTSSGANGISVKKTDTIIVNYTGSDKITFELVDQQLYLKSGSVKGDILTANTSPKSTYQDIIIGHASFITLKSVVEISNNGSTGQVAFKNSYKSSKVDITGTKVWVGGPTTKPDIQLQLYRNGVAYGSPVTLSSGSTTYTWLDLEKTDATGNSYTYTVQEVGTPLGYDKVENGLTVTNTYKAPSITTNAYEGGRATTDKSIAAAMSVRITDTVSYENLIPGNTYTLTGTLMDKATGQPLLIAGNPVKVVKSFTPTNANGTEDLDFTFNASALGGSTLVVFEVLTDSSGTVIAKHEDINDVAQTVSITSPLLLGGRPYIYTNAYEGGKATTDKSIIADANVTIVDTVSYENLIVGQPYTLTGTLMDKATGQPLLIAGNPVIVVKTFTPTNAKGTEDLYFTFDASALGGSTLVVYEVLTVGTNVVARHEDINDAAQTIRIENKPTVPSAPPIPQTGVVDNSISHSVVLAAGAILVGVMLYKNKDD